MAGPDKESNMPVIGNNLAISNNMTSSSNSTDLVKNQITSAMSKSKEQTSLKDEILNKITSFMDEKQKTHDSILFGTPIETAGAGAGSLVQQTKPKTESDIFMDKLKSYTIQPTYDLNQIKLPDSSIDNTFASSLPKSQQVLTTAPFSADSENGQLFDTHSQIVKMQDQMIENQMKKNFVQERSSSMLLKDLGLLQWKEDMSIPDLDSEQDNIYL